MNDTETIEKVIVEMNIKDFLPLTRGHLCRECNGTGADIARTTIDRRKHLFPSTNGYYSCWNCNGNGLDPLSYFLQSEVHKK
jgi:hypothetical protein